MITKNTKISDWVDNHNKQYINYCEAIILSNGDITYAVPSHQIKLLELYGISYDPFSSNKSSKEMELYNKIPIEADVCEWLCEDLQTISVWYNYAIIPHNYTTEALDTYLELVKHKCVSRESDVKVIIEKSLINLRNQERFAELDRLILDKSNTERSIQQLISSIN